MVESEGTQGNGTSKEITIEAITTGVSSVKEASRKVEATRLSLYYLLAKGRPLDSLSLLQQIDAKNLPFNPEERDKMLNGILKTAEGLRKEDPIQAWNTIWGITYSKAKRAPYGESRDFTWEEYERLNTQEFKDQQTATLAWYIECYLNPDIEIKGRERFARRDLSSDMNDTTSNLYHLDFDKVFDFLDKAAREKLLAIDRDHPLSVLKNKLQAGGETPRPIEKTQEETEEVEVAHKPVIEEVDIEGSNRRKLRVNGKDFGSVSETYREGDFRFLLEEDMPENYIDIPEGMEVYFSITGKPNPAMSIQQKWVGNGVSIIGGKDTRLDLKELYSLGIVASIPPFIGILTPKYKGWKERVDITVGYGRAGQAVIYDSGVPYGEPHLPNYGLWMSMEELENFLKKRKEEIENKETAGPTAGQTVADTEKDLYDNIGSDPKLKKSLFDRIRFGKYKAPEASRQQETDPVRNFIKNVMGENPRKYKISYEAIRIEDLGKENANPVFFRNYDEFRRFLRGLTPEQLETMKTYGHRDNAGAYYSALNINVTGDFWNKVRSNPEFQKAMHESGLFDRIRFGEVEFEKLQEAETAKPPAAQPVEATLATETLKSQVPQERKVKLKVTPISGRYDPSSRLVGVEIEDRETQIVWEQSKIQEEIEEGRFYLEDFSPKAKGELRLPNGTRLSIGTYAINDSPYVFITGGKNTAISMNDLRYFKERELSIGLQTNHSEYWKDNTDYEESSKSVFKHMTGNKRGQGARGLSVREAIDLLKESLKTENT